MWKDSKFRETDDIKQIYKNEYDKACFAHDAAYFKNKKLAKRTISDKVLKDRAYETAINSKRGLASMVHKFWQENKIGTERKWRTGSRVIQTSD